MYALYVYSSYSTLTKTDCKYTLWISQNKVPPLEKTPAFLIKCYQTWTIKHTIIERELIQHLYLSRFLIFWLKLLSSFISSSFIVHAELIEYLFQKKIASSFVISKQKDILTMPIEKGTPEYMACIEGHISTPCNCHF